MAVNVHNFHAKLPKAIYWDASFIVNFAAENSKYYDECQTFYHRLKMNLTPSFISTLSLDESWFILLQAKIEDDNAPKTFWQCYNGTPEIITNFIPQIEALHSRLTAQPHVSIIGIEPTSPTVALEKMKAYHFLPRDAYHLATMDSYNIKSIVTTDEHFLKVPDIEVYTCNPSMLKEV